jgi:hypothetical protein
MGPDEYLAFLELHLKFDTGSGTDFIDSSPKARTITEFNIDGSEWDTPSYTAAANSCIHFVADDGCKAAMDGESLNDHGHTFLFWVKFDDSGFKPEAQFGIYDVGNSQPALYLWREEMFGDVNWRLIIYVQSGNYGNWKTELDPVVWTDWHFIAITWTGSVLDHPIMYIDGSPITWAQERLPEDVQWDMDEMQLGYWPDQFHHLDGRKDDFVYYSTVLPPERILELFSQMPDMGSPASCPDLPTLDLADPVLTVVDILKDGFSEIGVEVVEGFCRGGYAKPHPRIIPVEGEVVNNRFKPRKGRTNLRATPGKAEVLVYEVSDTGDEENTVDEKFGNVRVRVTIDIYHAQSRARLISLYNEIRRCLYASKYNPGGNYHFLKRLQKTDLSNRKAGFWRYTQDVELLKVSDYFGHA